MAAGATEGHLPSSASSTPAAAVKPETAPELPKLSYSDFQKYNKLAVMMEYYHNNFRHTWTTLYTACERNTRPQGMSISQFLSMARLFIRHLTAHHTIEERHIFPILGVRMPEFRAHALIDADSKEENSKNDMLAQHRQIHAGLDRLEEYLDQVRRGERELRLASFDSAGGGGDDGDDSNKKSFNSLQDVLDSFGDVLWEHLDQEVKNLGAENMRRYWTKEEMADFNF